MHHRDGTLLARYPHTGEMVGRNFKSGPADQQKVFELSQHTARLMSPIDGEYRLMSSRALSDFPMFVPHFVAELAALLYMDIIPVRSAIARGRLAWFQRGYRRRTARLTRIDRDEPPRWTH